MECLHRLNANSGRPWIFKHFFQQDRLQDIFHNIMQDRFQNRITSPSNSLKLIKFKTYYIEPNPPLFFPPTNMQWSHNMVHSHFTLCLRARDYIKRLSQHPWYGLWMRVKGRHHYKVTALGSCVMWPLAANCRGSCGLGSWLLCSTTTSTSAESLKA